VGLETTVKRVPPRAPWSRLPPQLWFAPLRAPVRGSDSLAPPWPDLLIAAGRQSVALSIALRRRSGGAIFTVQILDPAVSPARFDLVVAPRHDRIHARHAGDNVIATLGALTRVTPARLAEAAAANAPTLDHLPRPRVAVLIGGASKTHRLDRATAAAIGERLAALSRDQGAGLMVTASRRTPAGCAAVIREHLGSASAVMWNGQGENPYFGYLGLADAIVATSDSVAMVSEACTTGKPVHLIDLPGGSAKFDRFHAELRARDLARPFAGRIESWTPPPLDETARVAALVRARLGLA